jgi:probable O-glycosylation ligase (exosortase A-associated)
MREILLWLVLFLIVFKSYRYPFWGVAAYVVFNIVRPEMLFWGGTQGSKVYIVLGITTLIFVLMKSDEYPLSLKGTSVYLLFLYIALLLSILFSKYDTTVSWLYINEFLVLCVIAVLLQSVIKNNEDVMKMVQVILYAFAFLASWGILQYFQGNYRLEGLGGNSYMDSNGLAAIFVLFSPVALSCFFAANGFISRLRWFCVFLLMVVFIICTSSRGGAIGAVIALSVFSLFSSHKKQIIALSFVFFLVASPFLTQSYMERMRTISSVEQYDYSGLSRIYLWKVGLQIFLDNPILGTGFLTFPQAKQEYRFYYENIEEELRNYVFRKGKVGHNTYVQVLSEAGILGFLPYSFMIITILFKLKLFISRENKKKGGHSHPLAVGFFAGAVGFSVCIFAIDALVDVLFPVLLTLSLIYVTNAESKERL